MSICILPVIIYNWSFATVIESEGFNHTIKMLTKTVNILLADDDFDDRSFFANALKQLPITTILNSVNDGEQLMDYLGNNRTHLPQVLFLDLSMPRKNGFECLVEIREIEEFKDMAIVMFSTSFPTNVEYEESMIKTLLNLGADYYIRKQGNFESIKQVIHQSLIKISQKVIIKSDESVNPEIRIK
jgi:DNA-binding NarL/FixJ family response regulator